MVHDPRVTVLLSRLGGLYRDPARIDRDASSLLKSSVGAHLTPGIAPLVENNGDSSHCLVLQGTIAIVFRGNTYQLLVDIYLPPGYPLRPPVSYVRLTQNMYLKENHPHVGNDGMVYMPYTHEWNQRTHSLIEMVVAMSSVFSADPPVFTRTTPAPAPPPPPAPPPVARNNPPPPAYDSGFISPTNGTSATAASAESERYMQEQIAAIMAKEAAEANRAAEIARSAAKEEEEKLAKQKVWAQQKQARVKDQVAQKIQEHLQRKKKECESNYQGDWRDQHYLKHSKTKVEEEIEQLSKTKDELQKYVATVDTKTKEIQEWLDEHAESKQNNEPASVDELCQPVSKLHAQMLDLSAENAAVSDALYFLDRGLYSGHIDCTTHLKTVRKLAKRQFLIRALLIKIDQILVQRNR
jgi:ESCRT-I complex subunit TSG101